MISEVVNTLFLTYIATEYTAWQDSHHQSRFYSKRWLVGRVICVLMINLVDRLLGFTDLVDWLVHKDWKTLFNMAKGPMVALVYVTALYYDCQTSRARMQCAPLHVRNDFIPRVVKAFCRILPVYPFAAVLISFGFMFVINIFEFLRLPVELLNWPIYYGTLYGPFSYIYMVVKQSSFPVVPKWAPYGWDWLTQYAPGAPLSCLATHRTTISEAYMLPNPDKAEMYAEAASWADWFRDFIAPDEEPMEPVSDVFYPIIDQLDRVTIVTDDYDPGNHTLVGVIAVDIYWRNVIKDILAPGSRGVVIVFENPCNDPFTYQIDGPVPKFLGVGDLHAREYAHLGIHSKLTDLSSYSARGSGYSGSPLDSDFCPFTLHVYPSVTYEDAFTTNNPIIFTIAAVVIFLFVSLIFILYDYSVARRQTVVMSRAVASSAIVSSLFPSQVRKQIYEEKEAKKKDQKDWVITAEENVDDDGRVKTSSRPNAEAYKHTTILFADLAGFTKWSQSRLPTDVFTLLETLYFAYDKIADRRAVFKVETIGDCYVACTGCPRPQELHACIMAKFARDIMMKTRILVKDLPSTLGEDTGELEMRIGLHSGEVTGGVLRGQKGRFQLFGDSMNTASRMESNGIRGHIHASQATADELTANGKGNWLTPREDKIVAKGLGELQTYWIDPRKRVGPGSIVSAVSSVSNDAPLPDVVATEGSLSRSGDGIEGEDGATNEGAVDTGITRGDEECATGHASIEVRETRIGEVDREIGKTNVIGDEGIC